MHLNDSSSIAVHLKSQSLSNPNFEKNLVEKTTVIAHEICKPWLKILEALHVRTKMSIINRINFENSDNVLKYL